MVAAAVWMTAGTAPRGDDFDYQPHVAQTTWEGTAADLRSAVEYIRSQSGAELPSVFTIGFCMGGRNAFLSSTLDQGLAGVIGFYGFPAPMDVIGRIECPVLGIFGGADQAIPVATVQQFRDALAAAGLENEIVVEPDAPHSFFDKKAEEFRKQSEDSWERVQRFLEVPTN